MQMQRTRPSPICWATSAVTCDEVPVELDGELDGVVDLGQGVRRELHVDDGAGDGDDPAVFECAGRDGVLRCGGGHCGQAPFDWRSASAPPTISMISVVMES